jgi:8-oxo-dGTP pyrophosphatase MutT (NUDIX family)
MTARGGAGKGSELKLTSVHAILRLSGKYVLQLRDDRPDIAASGQWSLFGGRINAGESPLAALRRELAEELSIRIDNVTYVWQKVHYLDFAHAMVRTWFYESVVDSVWGTHALNEGKAAGVFSFDELTALDMPDIVRQALSRSRTNGITGRGQDKQQIFQQGEE